MRIIERLKLELNLFVDPGLVEMAHLIDTAKGKDFNLKKAESYCELISEIHWFLNKISKYGTYFEFFYPSGDEISKAEALEHHIHAYLEDLYALENRIINYLNTIKNDIKKKPDKDGFGVITLEDLGSVTYEVNRSFERARSVRGKHRHKGEIFRDFEVLVSISLSDILKKDVLSESGKHKVLVRANEAFTKTSQQWKKRAIKNHKRINAMIELILIGSKEFLYREIGIKALDLDAILK